MEIKKIAVQVVVAMILFMIIAVILDGNYSQETWLEKGKTALLFGLAYVIFLILKKKFKKKK